MDGDGGEVLVDFDGAEQEVAASALKGVASQGVWKVGGIKECPLYIDPSAKIHGSTGGGYVFSGDEVGEHADLFFVVFV